MSEKELDGTAQVVKVSNIGDEVNEGMPVISVGTVDAFEIDYFRSATDNRRNGDEIVLLLDHISFGECGAVAYEMDFSKKGKGLLSKSNPIYPKGHTEDADWTGPAQKIYDKKVSKNPVNDFPSYEGEILRNRVDNSKSIPKVKKKPK